MLRTPKSTLEAVRVTKGFRERVSLTPRFEGDYMAPTL